MIQRELVADKDLTGQPGPEGTVSLQESEGPKSVAKVLILEPSHVVSEFWLPLWNKLEQVASPL